MSTEVTPVLVADDDADYRLLVTLVLTGHPSVKVVGEASNLAEARALAQKLQPGAILLDVSLEPAGLGQAVAQLVRAAPGAKILATSAGDGSDMDVVTASGPVIGHLSKAVRARDLARAIAALTRPQEEKIRHVDTVHLPAVPESARRARRFIEETLAGWGCDELVESGRLLISELVGNAVGHARSAVDVSVQLLDDRLHVEVADDCDDGLRRRAPKEFDMSGRGISIVEALAQSWGVRNRDVGKTVWFDLALPGLQR